MQISKIALILLFAVVSCLVAAAALAVSGVSGVEILQKSSNQDDVRVLLQAPTRAELNREFPIIATVQNRSDDPLHIEAIQLPRELLTTAVVMGISPGTMNQTHLDAGTAFQVNHNLSPGETVSFEITLFPRQAADLTGKLLILADKRVLERSFHLVFAHNVTPLPTETSTPTPTLTHTPTITPLPPTPTSTRVPIPYQAVVKITVKIRVFGSNVTGWTGSGTIISPDGLILTNAHLVTGDRRVLVRAFIVSITESQDKPPTSSYIAEVLAVDEDLDIALLQVETDANSRAVDKSSLDLPHVVLGDSDQLELGDPIIILGYPGIGGETITLTSGVVGGFTGEKEYGERSFIKTSANITGGTSGGMVMDRYGRMVAIPTQLGSGRTEDFIDCQVVADSNDDGTVGEGDSCLPVGGYINALRPINLALPIIERFMDIDQ